MHCKIAWAAFEKGIATDVVATKYGMAMTFEYAEQKYKKPSPEMCEERWEEVNEFSKLLESSGYSNPNVWEHV